jgi:hypothetical protein
MADHLAASQNDLARSHRRQDAINRVMLAAEKEENKKSRIVILSLMADD